MLQHCYVGMCVAYSAFFNALTGTDSERCIMVMCDVALRYIVCSTVQLLIKFIIIISPFVFVVSYNVDNVDDDHDDVVKSSH